MAFSDLISKDVAAPLAGFDKAVATGFELAQNQQKLGMAQQQIQLQQEQISQGYLEKATSLFPHFMRASGGTRKALGNAITQMMGKAGLGVDQDTLMLMNSDEQLNAQASQYLSQLQKEFPNNPAMIAARMGEFLQQPASDIYTAMTKAVSQQLSTQQAWQRMVYQQAQVTGRQLTQQDFARQKKVSDDINKVLERAPKDFEAVAVGLKTLEDKFGTPANPKEVDTMDLMNSLSTFARTIGQEKGPLTEGDVNRVFANTVGLQLSTWENYLSGNGKPPKELVAKLRNNLAAFKNNLGRQATSNLIGFVQRAQSNPLYKQAFDITVSPDGEVNVGYGAGQVIDRANQLIKNYRLFPEDPRRQVFNVSKWARSQAAAPSKDILNQKISQALQTGAIIKFDTPQMPVPAAPAPEEE